MLLKAFTPIHLLDNAQDLAQRLAGQIYGGNPVKVGTPGNSTNSQEESQATYAPLIQKQDYSLDWSKPAIALHNQVRAFFNCAATFEASC